MLKNFLILDEQKFAYAYVNWFLVMLQIVRVFIIFFLNIIKLPIYEFITLYVQSKLPG